MKKRWLKNIDLVWLIEGHLTEQQAKQVVVNTEEAMKFKRIESDKVSENRTVQLADRTVYNFRQVNEDAKNPN